MTGPTPDSATLAVDTAIGTAVALVDAEGRTLWQEQVLDSRRHAELIPPLLAEAKRQAAARGVEIDLVGIGMGPGPFTGLRVGVAAARAYAFGAGIRHQGVVSHDAAALALAEAGEREPGETVILHSDARRRERYGVAYLVPPVDAAQPPQRLGEPRLIPLDALAAESAAARLIPLEQIPAAALARVARAAADAGEPSLEHALYLRSPDVTLAPAKGVTG